MKRTTLAALFLLLILTASFTQAAEPLRIFLRGGAKTHGPAGNGLHDHEHWLNDWRQLLGERGAKVDAGMSFPTAEQLDNTDVLVMFAAEAGSIASDDRVALEKFLMRGGGIVCIHDAVCGTNAPWFKTIVGGAWEHGRSKWFEGEISFYYIDQESPITQGCSNFDMDDEVYWDLHMMPEAKILAVSWEPDRRNTQVGRPNPHIYNVIPQMWTYENQLEGASTGYRAFVSIPGHQYKSFNLPQYRAVLLRGIAWAGKRENVNELVTRDELASLRYPEGGPTAPEKAAAKLEIHPDFNISLVAAEPLINKPIGLDWDPAGRLWIAETPEYPNGRRGLKPQQEGIQWKDHGGLDNRDVGRQDRPARDRISILIDTNGDGRMDRKEIFYEGLELVTGFVFYKDGVIAVQAPDVLRIRDTDGDGKADKVEKLYTGLGIMDTHAVINNPRWGYDGWIYATHGYSASEHVRSGDGKKDFGRIGSGVVRFKPDASGFEQFSSKGGNTWGLTPTWDHEIMWTQPTSGDLLMHTVMSEAALARGKVGNTSSYKIVIKSPKSYPLMKWEQQAYRQIDLVGSFTASAGCAMYDGGTWPEEYNGDYFTTEPTINVVHHERITRQGVSYIGRKLPGREETEFIRSRDLWFRPIETRIGPDGALYILDFYNQAVIHNDTRGPMHNNVNAAVRPDRDHYFGRIWRVDHKQAKKTSVPNLEKASTTDLVKTLENPNRAVRATAQRLLVEKNDPATLDALTPLLASTTFRGLDAAKLQALWILHLTGQITPDILKEAIAVDAKAAVQKNALRIAAEQPDSTQKQLAGAVLKRVKESNAQVRLAAILALAAMPVADQASATLIDLYPDLNDPWSESAVVGAASRAPLEFIQAALDARNADALTNLVAQLAGNLAAKQDGEKAARLLVLLASRSSSAALTRQIILERLSKELKPETVPAWSDALRDSLKSLLGSNTAQVSAAVLPLAVHWDKAGVLKEEVKALVASLIKKLNDQSVPNEQRGQVIAGLVGVRESNPEILPSVAKLLGSSVSEAVQKRAIEALGATGDPSVGVLLASAYPKLSTPLQDVAFAQIIKRSDWAAVFVDKLKSGEVKLTLLDPASIHRLRTHSDPEVAKKAGEVIDELRGPEVKEKNTLIAKFTPEVEKPGDAKAGKDLFAKNCAVCHKFNSEGKEVGPELSGMGAHGPAELLVAILDPNREVDPSFVAWSIETKEGETYDGIIAAENKTAVTLRNNSGETPINASDIASRRNTGRSLMPEGFEALGADGLRDLLTYVCAADAKYRLIDLKGAFTADSTRGIYGSPESKDDSLLFKKFGIIKAGDVPFDIINPLKTSTGKNLLVLKGRNGMAKEYPQKVTIQNVNVKATKLHFLGGVGGWAWPFGGQDKLNGIPVTKVSVRYTDGEKEDFVFKNGVEFVDYIDASLEAPGSKTVPGVVSRGQVRTFSRALKGKTAIDSITFESFDNQIAPTFVAVTAEVSDAGAIAGGESVRKYADASAAIGPKSDATSGAAGFKWGAGIKTLIVGGGSSHDFAKWFGKADSATLSEENKASVNYTENPADVLPALKDIDVLYLCANQPLDSPGLHKAIFDFANAGKGLLLVHPALWYNWKDWPEYNEQLVGGGARSHDKYGEFEVTVDNTSHAIMAGVPSHFRITDELYHWNKADGADIQVLATGRNLTTGKTYPVVYVMKHPKGRIVCITLGHDGAAHELPAYKKLLQNALTWVAEK
jgi:putative membrane-bound dehydrogenase-like protein